MRCRKPRQRKPNCGRRSCPGCWHWSAPWRYVVWTIPAPLTLDERVGVPVTAAVQRAVHEKAAALPLRDFEQETYYTKLETAQQVDGDRLSDLLENLTWVLSSVVGVAGLMALYGRAHWLLAIVLVATVALHAIVESAMSRVSVEARYRNSPRRRERSYWSGLLSERAAAPGATTVSAGRSAARALGAVPTNTPLPRR